MQIHLIRNFYVWAGGIFLKRRLILTITILFALSIILYFKFEVNTKYTPLSQDEIGKFIKIKNIIPLSIEEIQDTSMILYENGIYELLKNNGKIIENHTEWGINSQEKVQIGMSGNGSPYTSVNIDDGNLLKQANEVEIVFSDGKNRYNTITR